MKKQIILASAIIILLIGNNLPANVTIELPLDCAGTYTEGASSWITNFNLGVTFTSISHVYIDWSFEITAAQAVMYYDPDNPFPQDVGIEVIIGYGNTPNWRYNNILGSASTYPNPEPFDTITEITKGPKSWDFLLDGKESIWIHYIEGGSMDFYYVEPGSVTLNNATLLVEGTVIPEPTSLILVSIGVIGVRISRKKLNIII